MKMCELKTMRRSRADGAKVRTMPQVASKMEVESCAVSDSGSRSRAHLPHHTDS